MYSGKHEQEPAPFCSLHTALGPHGEGMHGVGLSVDVSVLENSYLRDCSKYN